MHSFMLTGFSHCMNVSICKPPPARFTPTQFTFGKRVWIFKKHLLIQARKTSICLWMKCQKQASGGKAGKCLLSVLLFWWIAWRRSVSLVLLKLTTDLEQWRETKTWGSSQLIPPSWTKRQIVSHFYSLMGPKTCYQHLLLSASYMFFLWSSCTSVKIKPLRWPPLSNMLWCRNLEAFLYWCRISLCFLVLQRFWGAQPSVTKHLSCQPASCTAFPP